METHDFFLYLLIILLATIDAIQSQDEEEIDTLETLTVDRSSLMTKISHNYFDSEKELSEGDCVPSSFMDTQCEAHPADKPLVVSNKSLREI
jgi:hypothetical protein